MFFIPLFYKNFPLQDIGSWRQGLLFFPIPLGFTFGIIFFAQKKILSLNKESLCLIVLLISLPYSYAFGTNNDYWIPISCAGFFIALASFVPLKVISNYGEIIRITLLGGIAIQCITIIFLYDALSKPYRQPQPLFHNQELAILGEGKSKLILSMNAASYLERWSAVLNTAGFKKNTPMIDLSGHYPGLIFAIQGKSIGVASSLGGYPSSNKLLIRGLNLVSCEEITQSWILIELNDSNSISSDVLSSFGASLANDFMLVGSNTSLYEKKQFMYQPRHGNIELAIKKCKSARSENQ
jgi:hypothetical protein